MLCSLPAFGPQTVLFSEKMSARVQSMACNTPVIRRLRAIAIGNKVIEGVNETSRGKKSSYLRPF